MKPKTPLGAGDFPLHFKGKVSQAHKYSYKVRQGSQDNTSEFWLSQVTKTPSQTNFCSCENPNISWEKAHKTSVTLLTLPAFPELLPGYKEQPK